MNLRDAHNRIKNDIIVDAYSHIPYSIPSNEVSVLDLACGRGGDLHKYFHANYKKLYVVDNHTESLDIYKQRYLKSYKSSNFHIDFISHDLSKSVLYLNTQVDVVVTNFALNYFFKNEHVLENLLRTVMLSLKEGGLFVGIALDGVKVKESSLSSEDYIIEPLYTFHEKGPYNRAYKFSLKNSCDDYFNFRNKSMKEYLLCLKELDRVANIFQLEKIYHKYLQNIDNSSILALDVIFKYQKNTTKTTTRNTIDHFFPENIDYTKMKILPQTKNVCSRKTGSKLLCTTIESVFCKNVNLIIDATAHVGCDTLALSLFFKKTQIIAIEQDIETFHFLQHNISNVNEANNVTVLHGDSLQVLANYEQIDVLYIDAPWGGTEYKVQKYISLFLNDMELSEIINLHKNHVNLFVLKVPLNFDIEHLKEKCCDLKIEITTYVFNNKPKFLFLSILSRA